MTQLLRSLLLAAGVLFGLTPALAGVIFQVNIDTTPIAGASGYLAFDLLGGSPLQGNMATISGFATTGTLGTSSTSGNVTGTLTTPPVVLTASTFFNEFLRSITFGAGLTTFDLALSSNFVAGSTPDSFSFFLLDSTLTPYGTSDPSGADALFAIDVTGTPAPVVFTSPSAMATLTPIMSAVPEPGSCVLIVLGCGALLAVRAVRRAS